MKLRKCNIFYIIQFYKKISFHKIIKTVHMALRRALIANITFAKRMAAARFMHFEVTF